MGRAVAMTVVAAKLGIERPLALAMVVAVIAGYNYIRGPRDEEEAEAR